MPSPASSSVIEGTDEILKAIAAAASGEAVYDAFDQPPETNEPRELASGFDSDFWFGDSPQEVDDGDAVGLATEFDQLTDANPQLSQSLRQLEGGSVPSVSYSRWMGTQENGRIDLDELEQVAPGHFLRPDVAQAFKAMRRAARKDGVRITLTDSYRDFDTQVRLAQEKGLYSQGGLAAEPGTSNHGWGLAVDVDEGREWLARNGARFGFTDIPREPWHWEYEPGADIEYLPSTNAFRGPRNKKKKEKRQALTRESISSYKNPYTQSAFALLGALDPDTFSETPNGKEKGVGGNAKLPKGRFLSEAPKQMRRYFQEAARATGLPVGLLVLVAQKESGFDPNAVSSAGAQGVMQVMPLHGMENPFNARANILKGAEILASYMDGLGLRKGLAAYNAGPGNWQAGIGYADDILSIWRGGA